MKNISFSILTFYKILTLTEWKIFQKEGAFIGSKMDQVNGFIHLSYEDQKQKILDKFFKDQSVVIIRLDPLKMDQELLKIEENYLGGTKYPHYYGKLTLDMIKN
jgi:uncharacterized protein (DUF952 family)